MLWHFNLMGKDQSWFTHTPVAPQQMAYFGGHISQAGEAFKGRQQQEQNRKTFQ